MALSIIEAVKMGQWDYEPTSVAEREYPATEALPGTDEKLAILAERLKTGMPLWHPHDRLYWQNKDD